MENIWWSVIGGLIVVLLSWLSTWARNRYSLALGRRDPRLPSILFNTLLVVWCLAGIALHAYIIAADQSFLWLLPIYFVWSLAIVLYLWKQRHRLRNVGIYSADRQISDGVDYRRALALCHNKLKFLGIGASKLTREDEFARALDRCRQDQPAKFLLCKPTDQRLVSAAKKFGKPENEYRDIVINSLRKIAEFKNKRAINIEVRFYPKDPTFRLMLIDDSVCLFSYNVWGEGDGSQYPQLHILNAPPSKRVVHSFYYPLEVYFDNLWDLSEPWNFKDYLE